MTHGLVGIERTAPGEGEDGPMTVLGAPVERRRPAGLLHGRPAFREPEFRPAVAARLDEGEILAIRGEPRGETKIVEPDLVPWAFIVEGKARAAIPDLAQALAEFAEFERRGWTMHRGRRLSIGGIERIQPEDMLDVHQDQFLMLLFVIEPQRQERRDLAPLIFSGACEQGLHSRINMRAVTRDLVDARPRQEPALRPWMTRARTFVIGIEEIAVGAIQDAIGRRKRCQQKLLEKPAGMRAVPLGWRNIAH